MDIQDALKLLRTKFPKAKVAKLEIDDHNQYVAHIRVAEFPPKDDGGGEDEGGGGEKEAPAFEEDDGGEDAGPPAPPAPKDEGGKGGGELMSLVKQIAEAVGVGGGEDPMGGPDVGPGMPGLGPDLPDVGAPSGMAADKPLPPPAMKHNAPGVPGGASFAKRTMTVWREDDGVSREDFLREAKAFFPGYRVAKVERHMGKGANGYEGPVLVTVLAAD